MIFYDVLSFFPTLGQDWGPPHTLGWFHTKPLGKKIEYSLTRALEWSMYVSYREPPHKQLYQELFAAIRMSLTTNQNVGWRRKLYTHKWIHILQQTYGEVTYRALKPHQHSTTTISAHPHNLGLIRIQNLILSLWDGWTEILFQRLHSFQSNFFLLKLVFSLCSNWIILS